MMKLNINTIYSEDVNRDGSSIQLTSENTRSEFISTISHSYDNINYGCIGCRIGGFVGLYKLARSVIGSKKDFKY